MEIDENRLVVNLVQAMIGSVTPNLRAVFLRRTSSGVALTFLLERESAIDRDEIGDIEFEFQAMEPDLDVEHSIVVDASPLENHGIHGRLIFARRERE